MAAATVEASEVAAARAVVALALVKAAVEELPECHQEI